MLPRDVLPVHCAACSFPGTVTRTLWQRVMGRLACGKCRKTTTWKAS
jgi:hypothetical protein